MNRTITPEETEKLFTFCRQHYVYHYDLQVELVDHLGSSIEQQWKDNPEIPFNTALLNTFKKFGISGFSKIKEQKRKELARKYNRVLWKFFLEFYRWPKILMTLAGTMILFTLLRMVNNIAWVIVPYFAILVLTVAFYHFFIAPKKLNSQIIPGKKFMLLEHLKQIQYSVILFSQIPLGAYNISKYIELNPIHNPWVLMYISLVIISFNLLIYGSLFYIPNKVKEHFKEQFPEFAL